jgi:hypothetical protein
MSRRQRPTAAPRVEAIEPRVLPSLSMFLAAWSSPARFAQGHSSFAAQAAPPPAYNEVTHPTGTPSVHELRRTRSFAAMSGTFGIGPGRYSSQQFQLFSQGVGTANTFLHGDYQLRIVVPTDPTLPPTGAMTLFDRNTSAGSQLGLLLTGSRRDVDAFGRPTKFLFAVDQDVSGGLFSEATGQGTVEVRYFSKGPTSGSAKLLVRGQVYTLGTTFSLANSNIA